MKLSNHLGSREHFKDIILYPIDLITTTTVLRFMRLKQDNS